MQEVIKDEHLLGRGALWEVEDGFGGTFTLPANTPWLEKPAHTPRIPRLGEHRDSVLGGELGLSESDIARLERSGAFGSEAAKAASTTKADATGEPMLL